jgi:hypothetical protein
MITIHKSEITENLEIRSTDKPLVAGKDHRQEQHDRLLGHRIHRILAYSIISVVNNKPAWWMIKRAHGQVAI